MQRLAEGIERKREHTEKRQGGRAEQRAAARVQLVPGCSLLGAGVAALLHPTAVWTSVLILAPGTAMQHLVTQPAAKRCPVEWHRTMCCFALAWLCSIQEGLKQARKAGDDKKLGMVASRK